MPELSFIKASEAPQEKRGDARRDGRQAEYEAYVQSAIDNHGTENSVGKLAPSNGETTRGVRLRIAQAATRLAKRNIPAKGAVIAWTGPAGEVCFEYRPTAKREEAEAKAEPTGETANTNGATPDATAKAAPAKAKAAS